MISTYVGYGYSIGYNPRNLLTKIKLHLKKKKILDSSTKAEIFLHKKVVVFQFHGIETGIYHYDLLFSKVNSVQITKNIIRKCAKMSMKEKKPITLRT